MGPELLAEAPLMAFGLAVFIGVLAAVVNMVAGGGSALSLGLLLAMGMPPQVANGTNRLVVLVQSLTGSGMLLRAGRMPVRAALMALPAAAAGTLAGAWTASVLDEGVFRLVLAWLFAGLGVVLLWQMRGGQGREVAADLPAEIRWWMHPLLLLAGFMAGFIQMGVGIVILLVLHVLGRMEIVSANGIKIALAVMFSVVSLAVFVVQGQVDWTAGIGLAVGGLAGAVLGIRLMLWLPQKFIRWLLVVFVFVAAWRLWVG